MALVLAGPALSLPSMLVLRSIMGTKKTVVYVSLVIVMATFTGLIYGALFLNSQHNKANMKLQILGPGCAKCNTLAQPRNKPHKRSASRPNSRKSPT